jgi:hypothetical protein
VDQGDLAAGGSVLAPPRRWLTPSRTLLLTLGAVVAGIALSLLLGSSPAHAADGDGGGPGAGLGPLATATSSVATATSSVTGSTGHAVTAAITTALDQGIPFVKHSVDAAGVAVAATVPAAAPAVTPVVTTVDAALNLVQQLTAPARDALFPITNEAAAAQHWSGPGASARMTPAPASRSATGGMAAAQRSPGTDGMLPAPILTSSSGAPLAALGVVLGILALALIAGRRRLDDDALPSSPVYETDTSPA